MEFAATLRALALVSMQPRTIISDSLELGASNIFIFFLAMGRFLVIGYFRAGSQKNPSE